MKLNLIKDDANKNQLSSEILEELDWCLTQLENMQSHKSISDVASIKVNYSKTVFFVKFSIKNTKNRSIFSIEAAFFQLQIALLSLLKVPLKYPNNKQENFC